MRFAAAKFRGLACALRLAPGFGAEGMKFGGFGSRVAADSGIGFLLCGAMR